LSISHHNCGNNATAGDGATEGQTKIGDIMKSADELMEAVDKNIVLSPALQLNLGVTDEITQKALDADLISIVNGYIRRKEDEHPGYTPSVDHFIH
jgi:hypothetical protein